MLICISLVFRWIAIPWVQAEIDKWIQYKNRTAPRADRNKILPHGIPFLIRSKPHHFNALDFKATYIFSFCILYTDLHSQIPVSKELLDEMEATYAPRDDPVFQLVPTLFDQRAKHLYSVIGQPVVSSSTMWDIFRQLLHQFRTLEDPDLEGVLTSHGLNMDEDLAGQPKLEVLANMKPFRLGSNIGPKNAVYVGGVLESSEPDNQRQDEQYEYAYLTTDSEEEDNM